MTTKDYFHDSELSVDVFNRKYKIEDEEYEDAVKRVVISIAKMDAYNQETLSLRRGSGIDSHVNDLYERWFTEIMDDYWHPAGSIMAGVGSNSKKVSTYNCTTIGINGDTLEDIAEARYKLLKFAAYRQGIGVDFSPLRPNGSYVDNSAKISTGSLNWMDDFNEAAKHVGQAGRIPALLFSLQDWHPDFPEFITVKSDLQKIENANISAQLSDAFMEAVKNDEDWVMSFETDHELMSRVESARDLYNQMLENNLNYAEPGAQFIDTIRKYSNSDYVGAPVVSSNACSEKFLDPSGACNLASINLGKLPTEWDKIISSIKYIVPSVIRFLDNVIDYEEYSNRNPTVEQFFSQRNLRRLGLGITNLHAWLIKMGVDYGSKESIEITNRLMGEIMYQAYKASIELGKEKGSFKLFDRKKFEESPYVKRMIERGLEFTHMRNVEIISIAPTGSLSTMFSKPVMSYGVEPAFGLYYWKRTRISGKYEYYFVVPEIVYSTLLKNGVDLKKKGLSKLTSKDTFDGRVGKRIAKIIDKHSHLFNFTPARNIKPIDKVNLMSAIAEYVDSSISTSYILPESAKIEDADTIFMNAWKKGVKSVAVYRDSTRYGIVEFVPFKERVEELYKDGFVLNSNELSEDEVNMLGFSPFQDKKYSKVVNGNGHYFYEHKFTAEGGDKFYVHLRDDEKKIFIINYKIENRASERLLAIANKLGSIVKDMDESIYYKQIERSENSLNRFTRMLSVCLKHDLKKEALDILDEFAVVGNLAWYLVKRVFKYEKNEKVCMNCGSANIIPSGDGCWECVDCGSSKCE